MVGVIAVITGIAVKTLYLDLDNEEHDSSGKLIILSILSRIYVLKLLI
jgi:hypothetical protein